MPGLRRTCGAGLPARELSGKHGTFARLASGWKARAAKGRFWQDSDSADVLRARGCQIARQILTTGIFVATHQVSQNSLRNFRQRQVRFGRVCRSVQICGRRPAGLAVISSPGSGGSQQLAEELHVTISTLLSRPLPQRQFLICEADVAGSCQLKT